MEPKRSPKRPTVKYASPFFTFRNALQIQLRFFVVFGGLWEPFGLPLALFLLILGAFWACFGGFWATNRKATPSKTSETDPNASGNEKLPRICRDSAEDCREPAKNCREPSQNPPRTCRTNLKQKNIPRYGFYESTSFSDRRSNKTPRTKVGRPPPWGNFN